MTNGRKNFNPGAQFNIYRSSLPTEYARAVLHHLLTDLAETQGRWTNGVVTSLLTSKHCGPESDTPRDFLDLDVYDDKQLMGKMSRRITEVFETWTHDAAKTNNDSGAYRAAAWLSVDIAARVTALFPDLTCNHDLSAALEAVIMNMIISDGQDQALARVQAAIIHGMVAFTTSNAQRRAELPNGTPISPLVP